MWWKSQYFQVFVMRFCVRRCENHIRGKQEFTTNKGSKWRVRRSSQGAILQLYISLSGIQYKLFPFIYPNLNLTYILRKPSWSSHFSFTRTQVLLTSLYQNKVFLKNWQYHFVTYIFISMINYNLLILSIGGIAIHKNDQWFRQVNNCIIQCEIFLRSC